MSHLLLFDSQYGSSLNCTWTISPPGTHYTVATFSGVFDIEGTSGRNCRFDSVEVVEAVTNQSRGKYCGVDTPPSIATMGPMRVNFKTDSTVNK